MQSPQHPINQSICHICDERPSTLPSGSCKQCAFDDELDRLLYEAAKRAASLEIDDERFLDLAEAALDGAHIGEATFPAAKA